MGRSRTITWYSSSEDSAYAARRSRVPSRMGALRPVDGQVGILVPGSPDDAPVRRRAATASRTVTIPSEEYGNAAYAGAGAQADAYEGSAAGGSAGGGAGSFTGMTRRAPNGETYVYVEGYVRANGTKVRSHWRQAGSRSR